MRRTALLALLAAAAVAVAGCGSDENTVSPDVKKFHGPLNPHPRTIWGEPSGPYAGKAPRALVMLIHGGGWRGQDPRAIKAELPAAHALQERGYATAVVEYRPAEKSLRDVIHIYRVGRKRFGPDLPICASGSSAGGHLALMLAAREPGLACAISNAGVTDLLSLKHQPGGDLAYRVVKRKFGRDRLAALSPINYADSIKARVLMIYAKNDPIAPPEQGVELARAMPQAQLMLLPPGPVRFVHGFVSPQAKASAEEATLRLLASVSRSHP